MVKIRLAFSLLYSQIFLRFMGLKIGKNSFLVIPTGIIRKYSCITLGKNTRILYNARIDLLDTWNGERFNPNVVIGDNVNSGQNLFISCAGKIKVGNGVLISDNVALVDNDHAHSLDKSSSSTPLIVSDVIIEDNVTIYRNVTILSGSVIGKGSVVAANSVVRGVYPPNVLIGGTPGRILKSFV
jgi:acetyltransferase-like isoleucine patch superfamily enzyme